MACSDSRGTRISLQVIKEFLGRKDLRSIAWRFKLRGVYKQRTYIYSKRYYRSIY